MFKRIGVVVTTAACVAASMAGCSLGVEVDGNEPPVREPAESTADRALPEPARQRLQPPPRWTCMYVPSFDRDWHNDVRCTKFTRTGRIKTRTPYLRPWDSFITESEMKESIREFERELNARAGETKGGFGCSQIAEWDAQASPWAIDDCRP